MPLAPRFTERTWSSSCHRASSLVTPPAGSGVSLGFRTPWQSLSPPGPSGLEAGARWAWGLPAAVAVGSVLCHLPCPPSLQWADSTVCTQLAQPRRHPGALMCHLALSTPSVTSCSVSEPHGQAAGLPALQEGCLTPCHPLWPPVLGEPRGYPSGLHAFASQCPSRHWPVPGDAVRTP